MPKSKSGVIIRQILLGIGMLAAAGGVILAFLTWRASQRLSDKVAALRSAGDPVSIAELAPAPIPPTENAAVYLQNISVETDAFAKDFDEFYKTPIGEALDVAEEKGEPPTAEQLAAMRAITDRYPGILDALGRASRCEKYASLMDFNLPSDKFFERLIHQGGQMRAVARLAKWKAAELIAEGKPGEAAALCTELLRLTHLYEHEPSMINYLIAVACRGMAIESLNQALRAGPIPADQRAALERELAACDDRSDIAAMYKTERAFSMTRFESLFPQSKSTVFNWVTKWKTRDWQCDVLDYYEGVIGRTASPWYQTGGSINAALPQMTGASGTLVSQLFPAVQAVYQASNRDQALLRCLRILNALEDYRAIHGNEAQSVTDLSLSPQTIIDPFSGARLKLKKTPEGWVIYSVMNNGADDQGDFKDMKDWGLAPAGYGHEKPADDGGQQQNPGQ
jgi:hypothetical protein